VEQVVDVDQLIDALIDREGAFVSNPADKGGPTCFGITEAVARANGYAGPMRQLPREDAAAIYKRLYWLRPAFDQVARRSPAIAAELFDTGVNMGPAVAATFLQRALTALNRNGSDYPDLMPDGKIGAGTLGALDAFLSLRGKGSGETVLMRAIEALQGERYLRLAERRPGNYILDKASNRVARRGPNRTGSSPTYRVGARRVVGVGIIRGERPVVCR
jgi:lysozyme family protein